MYYQDSDALHPHNVGENTESPMQTVSLLAGLAWLVIPKTWTHFSLGFVDFQSWRLFVVLCSIPSLSSAFIIKLFMPESPKFLMEVRQKT